MKKRIDFAKEVAKVQSPNRKRTINKYIAQSEKSISLIIDGKTINAPEGTTVLQAVRMADIYIPTLCYLDCVPPYGACRLCIVDIEGIRGYPTACTTPVASGMLIKTKTQELQQLRKRIFEMTLSEHPYTCLVCKEKEICADFMHTTRKVSSTTGCNFCPSNGFCELQELVDYLELEDVPYATRYRGMDVIKNNPFYQLDYNLCVLCGRCVRICNEERSSGVLAFIQRGNSAIVGTAFNESQIEAGCEYCGACVDVCPTGSLSEKIGRWNGSPDMSVETSCIYCSSVCKKNINSKSGKIINVGPEKGKQSNPYELCVRGKFVPPDITNNPERLTSPMIRKGSQWIAVDWQEAINFTAGNLEKFRGNQFGAIGSAQSSIEDNYCLQKFTRKVMRSNNIDVLNAYPEQTLLNRIHNYYLKSPPPEVDNIPSTETILIIGSHTCDSHPIVENRIRKAYKNKNEVILVNSRKTRTSNFSTQNYFIPHGSELVFLSELVMDLVNSLPDQNKQEYKELLSDLGYANIPELKTCKPNDLSRLTRSLKSSGDIIFVVGDGLLRISENISIVNTIINIVHILNSITSCKVLFLYSEGNHFGTEFAGMNPGFLPGFDDINDETSLKKWSENWDAKLSSINGMSANEMVNNIAVDGITTLLVYGNIPPQKNLSNLKFMVQCNMFKTETSEYADVIFPLSSFSENSGHLLDHERIIKSLSQAVKPPLGTKNMWEIISLITDKIVESGFDYKNTADIFSEIDSFTDLHFSGRTKNNNNDYTVEFDLPVKDSDYPVCVIIEDSI